MTTQIKLSLLGLCLLISAFGHADKAQVEVEFTLNQFHHYAAKAKGREYFALMADDMVYLGTDANERWSKEDFKRYAMPYFKQGRGWTYRSRQRHIYFNQNRDTAWFDELLHNEKYGLVRGSGVLVLGPQGWKFKQYNLAFPIPNALAGEFTQRIKQHE